MNYGFFRVAAAAPRLRVADPDYNAEQLETIIDRAVAQQVRLLVTPELSVTGYTCADLFFTAALQQAADRAVHRLAAYTAGKDIAVLIGAPVPYKNSLYNCALLLRDGQVQGMVPKVHLANYNEFYEKRWFASGADFDTVQMVNGVPMGSQLFDLGSGVLLGVELCEDLWVPQPPSGALALQGANLIANLSASDEYVSKAAYRRDLVAGQSARCVAGYVYAGAGVHESTTDLVFSGATLVAENGGILAEGERFARESVLTVADVDVEKLNAQRRQNMSFENRPGAAVQSCPVPNAENDLAYRIVDPHPFVPAADAQRRERCKEIFLLQASGLAGRLEHVGSKGCVLGISGGLDSTLALLVAVRAMELLGQPASAVLGVTMPGFGTTDRTYRNALDLMEALGVTRREISIADACVQHMADIGHDPSVHDITYENTQARERTQILFDLANKEGCLLVGTGDLSELAMGWCTYNGDHMSMYGVNASVPKTLVRYLVDYVAGELGGRTEEILRDVLDTPVSPELLPPDANGKIAQKTEEKIGPYELHDFFLYHFVRFGFDREKLAMLAEKAFDGRYDRPTIDRWLTEFLRRFFISQFKRSCIPDSPKVGSVSLSPRGDWRMPSDAAMQAFLQPDERI